MEVSENNEKGKGKERDEIFSKAVRAGKRTYFFDVKATRRDDYYLTITESKKKFNQDGTFYFEKHKLFLYKEDFEKFSEGLEDVVEYIKANQPDLKPMESERPEDLPSIEKFTDVEFDDLDDAKV